MPVINENDTTATDEITFGDNDFLAAQVAIMLDARLLVLLTNTDGLYTADPGIDPDAELVEHVEDFSGLAHMQIGDRTSVFGSGGMRSKVAAAEMATRAGVEVRICNGTVAGTLAAAASGRPAGTSFDPAEDPHSGYKLWLRYAKPVAGAIEIDDGAANVLRETGSSLLPVGVVSVEGDFSGGDAIEIRLQGVSIGKGVTNFSADEIERIRGLRTPDVRSLISEAPEEEDQRDHLVLD